MIRYRARWVVPITRSPLDGGVVAVADDGSIAYIGEDRSGPPGRDVDLGNVVLLPGLVNAHCHLELTVMRGFLEGLPFREWIRQLTTARRAVLTDDMMLDSARVGLDEGLRAGITTYADTGASGVVARAMHDAGVRGIVYQEVFGPAAEECSAAMAGLRGQVEAQMKHQTGLVRIGVSPHAPYTVSDDLFRAVTTFSTERGLPMAIHIAESDAETALVCDGQGDFADALRVRGIPVSRRASSPVQLLSDLGVLEAHPLLIHVVRADASDIRAIADGRCSVAHCPVSNAKLGMGVAPLLELLDARVPVGLGSDSVASNNRMHLLEEARAAILMQRVRLGSHGAVSAALALELATLGGARALGLDNVVGSIEVGKVADLAAFSLDRLSPTYDPITAAVFSLGGSAAAFVAVNGVPLVVDGTPVRSAADSIRRLDSAADALRSWRRTTSQMSSPRAGPGLVQVASAT